MNTQIFKMVRNSIKYWYIPLIVGIILIGLGIYTFTSPQEYHFCYQAYLKLHFLLLIDKY